MTLFKQIALLVSAMFLVLLTIIVVNDLSRAARFHQGQLQTTAQDMATTLGITIGNLPEGADAATLEVLFNAVFDSGYYSRIALIGIDGKIIQQKGQALEINDVPQWFIDLVPLHPASGATQVMNGWTQLGQLELEIHPGFAYANMYESLNSMLRWFALLFSVSLIVLWLVLRFVLEPLQKVRQQAEAIRDNRFVQQTKIPATVELRRVVQAMNLMVDKVKSIIEEQEKTLERYQKLLYRDKLTDLGNRRYLLDQLTQSMSEETGLYGCMAIVKIVGFDQLRDQSGYEVSDNLLRILADLLRRDHAGQRVEKASRFNEDELAFLSSADDDAAAEFVGALFEAFRELAEKDRHFKDVRLLAGISDLEPGAEIGNILSGIDYCLSQANTQGPFSIQRRRSSTLELPEGKMRWRAWLESVIVNKRLFLVGQLALGSNEVPVQRELFIRARNERDEVIPASAFMPMASSLGMALDIDREVFRMASAMLESNRDEPLAINLSAAFFEQAQALEEFDQLLADGEKYNARLCIEASHHVLNQHPAMCRKISERTRSHSHQFGIDNLDLGQPLQLLKTGQFDYVKINAGTLRDLSRDDMPAGFQALRTITDTLDIRIIAVAVDSQEVFDRLESLGIDTMQGNLLGMPEPV